MMLNLRRLAPSLAALVLAAVPTLALAGQAKPATPPQAPATSKPATPVEAITPPPGYVIGTDDVLIVSFYQQKEMSAEVVVRPDGMITLQLLNDIKAVGLTPTELGAAVVTAASKFYQDPVVTVSVKQINSRRVYVQGAVAKPGPVLLSGPMTVAQLISVVGGLADWANAKNITIIRSEGGKQRIITVNYDDIKKGKNLEKNNIELRPGDTFIVR